jgi:hypothetical protein
MGGHRGVHLPTSAHHPSYLRFRSERGAGMVN